MNRSIPRLAAVVLFLMVAVAPAWAGWSKARVTYGRWYGPDSKPKQQGVLYQETVLKK